MSTRRGFLGVLSAIPFLSGTTPAKAAEASPAWVMPKGPEVLRYSLEGLHPNACLDNQRYFSHEERALHVELLAQHGRALSQHFQKVPLDQAFTKITYRVLKKDGTALLRLKRNFRVPYWGEKGDLENLGEHFSGFSPYQSARSGSGVFLSFTHTVALQGWYGVASERNFDFSIPAPGFEQAVSDRIRELQAQLDHIEVTIHWGEQHA